jgi:hypothetical protein
MAILAYGYKVILALFLLVDALAWCQVVVFFNAEVRGGFRSLICEEFVLNSSLRRKLIVASSQWVKL